jgi:hypothetical protein
MAISHQGLPLSNSNGKPILVSNTTAPGQLVHTSSLTDEDFITLYAANIGDETVTLHTLVADNGQAGSGGIVSNVIELLPKTGKTVVEPSLLLSNADELWAYASTNEDVVLTGHVYRRALIS